MTWKERRRRGRLFWMSLPPLASALFFASVFFLFGSIGFISAGPREGLGPAGFSAFYSAAIAVAFAWLGTRGHYLGSVALALVVALGSPYLFRWVIPQTRSLPGPGLAALFAVVAILVAYVLMLVFIGTEGRRFHRLHTEIELAVKIQQTLAPAVQRQIGDYEFAGAARPSGEVGGDLVDVVESPQGWFGYIADVAGHGVAAGVLTGLVKSAVRTNLLHSSSSDGMVANLNHVLNDLLPPESFVAFAGLGAVDGNGLLRFVAAGQPPMLHFQARTGAVQRVAVENFPLGMFPQGDFASVSLACLPGDVLAVFTDGFTEVCDRRQREFGLDRLSEVLGRCARQPLPQALAELAASVQAFGLQTDDQTMLLIRRRPDEAQPRHGARGPHAGRA